MKLNYLQPLIIINFYCRPPFHAVDPWLQALCLHLDIGAPLPTEIQGDPLVYATELKEKQQTKLSKSPARASLKSIKETSKDDQTDQTHL